MKLITSADTLSFLSQVAPRPWVQRMLRWMILDDELHVYFSSGKVQPFTTAFTLIAELVETAGVISGPKMDAAIREAFSPEIAAKLVGKALHDRIDDDLLEWDESEEPRSMDPGFFL